MRGLRAFRVEVTIGNGQGSIAHTLTARGFDRLAADRYVAQVPQDEKVSLVNWLMKDYADALTDLTVTPVEDLRAALIGKPKHSDTLTRLVAI